MNEKKKKQQGGIFRMPAKIMRFFKKPSGILAVLMAVALLGTSSLYAMRTFAEGDVPTIPDDILASNYTSDFLLCPRSGNKEDML